MASKRPTSVTIRSYQVGFGDCFLLSFHYGEKEGAEARHVLIDFGSTGKPPKSGLSMKEIASLIREACTPAGGGKPKLHAVVATHRHADHISGFGGTSGEIIAGLEPDLVLQPWTEDPDAAPDAREATAAAGSAKGFVARLDDMHAVSAHVLSEVATLRGLKTVSAQLGFLGEENLKNLDAIRTLQDMPCRHVYASYGVRSGLEKVLPGVRVRVLGPPTLKQSAAIQKQRDEDAAEFWHLQAQAVQPRAADGATAGPLFPRAAQASSEALPFQTRWFLPRLDALRGEQLLEIVRILDKAMNNTSLILLFEVGKKKLLFPGDAQIENWLYALTAAKDSERIRKLLAEVDVYKVGHHGSLNATPKTLWNLFQKKSETAGTGRLQSLLSTMSGKHGSTDRNTEVPRRKLIDALEKETTLYSTQKLTRKSKPCNEVRIPV
jgi:hypothetical protein